MDGVILVAILVPSIIVSFMFMMQLLNDHAGTKGIVNKPYKTKSGRTHTARKSREQHIV